MPLIPRYIANKPGFASIGSTVGGTGGVTAPLLPPAYIGPADIATPIIGYSVRALKASFLGQPIFTLRSAAGGTQSINALVSNGKADQTSAAAFLGLNNGYLQSWIDQGPGGFNTRSLNIVDPNESGYNPDPWPGENALQPKYVANAIAGCPAFDPSQSIGALGWGAGWTETQTGVAVPSSYTVFCVVKEQSSVSAQTLVSWDVQDTSTPNNYFHVTGASFSVRDESIDLIAQWANGTGAPLVYTDTWNGTSGSTAFSYLEVTYTATNGDPLVKNTATFSSTTTSAGPGYSGYTPPYPVYIFDPNVNHTGPLGCEFLIYPALSSSVRQQIRQNIGTFYGISVAP